MKKNCWTCAHSASANDACKTCRDFSNWKARNSQVDLFNNKLEGPD